ncbi:guanylate cyclase [Bacterioplanes sanyensis]|uniref:CHASE2 domain-containing protein n=1 Tax=Bacterioplanes sanyensis TaxID=1249553 RepID=UPI00167877E4|nr:adenylate/guanylate cyclase domain-containing protein [Bacterioplanes sanyensis]GGY38494.1 guanylate cyclase [Bacterioplanes sanyensis]
MAKRWRYYVWSVLVGLLVTMLMMAAFTRSGDTDARWLNRLDYLLFDLRFQLLGAPRSDLGEHRIVIVDIDETSLAREGRWPWSRQVMGRLTRKLAASGAVVVVYDVVFSEAERNPLDEVIARAREQGLPFDPPSWRMVIDADQQFAASLQPLDVVLGFFFLDQVLQHGELPPPLTHWSPQQRQQIIHINKPGYAANIASLQYAAGQAGFVTTFVDGDGVVRRSPLLIAHQGDVYPSLALAAAMSYLLIEEVDIDLVTVGQSQAIRHINLAGQRIRTDAAGQVIVPYRGVARSFPYISATSVLNDESVADQVDGAIVMVGTSAQGLADLRTTPLQTQYPGVEVHANLLDGLLRGQFPYRPEWEAGAVWAQLLLLGLLLSLWLPRLSPGYTLLLSGGCLVVVVGLNYYWWYFSRLDLRLASPLILILTLMLLSLGDGFRREYVSRRRLRGMFDQYVPPAHIEQMMDDPQQYRFGGESRELTVLFSDIRDFTRISEQLSASELKKLLNRYFTPITAVIFDHDGTIDKYVGDMVMAFWGAPLADPRHASKAVAAALAMQSVTKALSRRFQQQGLPAIRVGIGLHTGVMNVGDMGSAYRRSYTVLGDAVNLGARLESITKFYQVPILVSESTCLQASEYVYQFIDCIQVKGKETAVRVYRPLALHGQLDQSWQQQLALQETAYHYYLQQQWQQARASFEQLRLKYPDCALYAIYLQRIDVLEQQPPAPQWNGVYRHESK